MLEEQIIQEILNHMTKLNDEVGQIQIDIAILKEQMAQLMWWFRAVMFVSVGFVITQIWQIIIMKRNNKR